MRPTQLRHNFMSYFKMNQLAWNNMLDNNFADNRNWGCLDEFWYVTALYGTMKKVHSTGDQSIELPEFTGSPLRIDKAAGWQGKCDLELLRCCVVSIGAVGEQCRDRFGLY